VIRFIADTHTAIWYLFQDPRLSLLARQSIEAAAAMGDHVGVSAISLAEMVYLVQKERIHSSAVRELVAALREPANVLQEVPLDVLVAQQIAQVPRAQVPDLPDRILAATALRHGVPVISRDGRIRASSVQTIW
jgi:PIN domain nuclease of toxin-antitoxin system